MNGDSHYGSANRESHNVNDSGSSSISEAHQRALISVLQEMRSLEGRLQQQSRHHAAERSALTETLGQQSKHISQLEQTNRSLTKENEWTVEKETGHRHEKTR